MRERPILFSAPMVRAILEGRKTVTRRVVKPQPGPGLTWAGWVTSSTCRTDEGKATWAEGDGPLMRNAHQLRPRWQVGDRLWVQEAWRAPVSIDRYSGSAIAEMCHQAGYPKPWAPVQFEADGMRNSAKDWREFGASPGEATPGRYRNARFMPRWASRINLEVTAVRVERLLDVTEAQAMAEGIDSEALFRAQGYAPLAFERLWDSINGAGSWADNPWVWVVEFERVEVPDGN